ncbi:hypothetical protein Q7P35_009644 [Cladosporium inversicolor]
MPFQLRTAKTATRRVAITPIARTFIPSRLASNASSTTATSPKNATGAKSSSAANPTGSQINEGRATDSRTGSPDTASVQTPVSDPGQAGAAQSEEPQQSQENMRRDPSEPDHVKREHVEKEGTKPLDPADKPVTGRIVIDS